MKFNSIALVDSLSKPRTNREPFLLVMLTDARASANFSPEAKAIPSNDNNWDEEGENALLESSPVTHFSIASAVAYLSIPASRIDVKPRAFTAESLMPSVPESSHKQ